MGEVGKVIVDGVFSGGGMKAIALVGALRVMEKKGYRFNRTAGTSAGALVAALITAGYHSEEMESVLKNTALGELMDTKSTVWFPFMKWLKLYWKMGLYRGDALENWIRSLLCDKGVETFGDLPQGTLRVVASDLSNGRIVVMPDDLERYGILAERFSVARAVRMSCTLPYFYQPVFLYDRAGGKSVIVDGGVLSNFPIWLFNKEETVPERPVIGFHLSRSLANQPARKIHNAVDLYQGLFATMKEAHDARYINEDHASKIVFIPVDKVAKATQLDMDEETKQALIDLGKIRTEKFLKKWTF